VRVGVERNGGPEPRAADASGGTRRVTPLRLASDVEDFVRRPVGAGVLVETSFVWCASPTLAGSTCWGAPDAEQTRRVMRVFDTFLHPDLGPQLDVVLDGYLIEHVHAGAVVVWLDWTRRHLDQLRRRIRRQIGVPPPGVGALMLSGMLALLGETHPYRLVATPKEAYRLLLRDRGDALREQIATQVASVSNTSAITGALRALLRASGGDLTLEKAARRLHRSTRSLQRALIATGSSFRSEQLKARLAAAEELLSSSDDKLTTIAARLGLTEQGLNRLIRDRLGLTPDAWRRQLRSR
jgi:AraC-like DNA-binding protein